MTSTGVMTSAGEVSSLAGASFETRPSLDWLPSFEPPLDDDPTSTSTPTPVSPSSSGSKPMRPQPPRATTSATQAGPTFIRPLTVAEKPRQPTTTSLIWTTGAMSV